MSLPDDKTLRAAVAARNRDYDGRFVFGVITTGIYCRPSCPARAARPENLRFFADCGEAETAGFRACKRCKPRTSAGPVEVLQEVARFIEQHADEKLTLARLAEQADLSASRLQRAFKAEFGVSPKVYQNGIRMRQFKAALKRGESVTGAITEAGYGSSSRLYGQATRNIGMTPRAYRAGGAGERIGWVVSDTVLGPLMMAATDRGVCFVQFGTGEAALLQQLESEFPEATLEKSVAADSLQLADWIVALEAHLAGSAQLPDLPLDLRGTAFQLKVWRFLVRIPEGEVISYTELAEGIGKPRAVRAAASACARNRVALLVPCHRVLRGDGSLGGYRWGLERKRALLDKERARIRKQ